MKERRKNKKRKKGLLLIYLAACMIVVIIAYFHLSRIARNYNTEHLELITGLYAEKMNETMDYLQTYAKEDVKTIQSMEGEEPETILSRLVSDLDQTVFFDIGFIEKDGTIYGSDCAIDDLKKKELDKLAISSTASFISDPYQSSETGRMVMTVFVPVTKSKNINSLYVSIMIEDLRKLGIYELLQGKVSVHLLKADSENFITCISSDTETSGNWNNLLLQQKYFTYSEEYTYSDWVKDMRAGIKEGRFTAKIRGEESTIAYRSISSMPGWYIVVELANKNISDITQLFSAWGGVYGSILVGFTALYMFTIILMEKRDKKRYIGLSTIDELTQILNRRAFQAAVEEAIAEKTPGIFIFIDVDNFKKYNDTYGHDNGDLCLKHFAEAMKTCFPEGSLLGRYGGDEFVVYLKNSSEELAHDYMDQFQQMISHFTVSTGEEVSVTASAGASIFPDQGEDFISLCRSADSALYEVKRNGKAAFKMKSKK